MKHFVALVLAFFALEAPGTGSEVRFPIKEDKNNTVVFNHYWLRIEERERDIPVLSVKDGEWFQVRFRCTDPRKFNYSISAAPDERPPSSETGTGADNTDTAGKNLTETQLVMRHDRHFKLYTVRITLREDLKPAEPAPTTPGGVTARAPGPTLAVAAKEPLCVPNPEELVNLRSTAFPIWVHTRGWELSFNGGFAFSGLTSDNYFVRSDDKGTDDEADDTKTVEATGGDSFRPDVVASANLRHPSWRGLGLSFGLGLGDEAEPRYFFGPSFEIGASFVVSAGWAGGRVMILPHGQGIGEPPVNGDNTLTNLPKEFRHRFYAGISFTFAQRENEFLEKLSVSSTQPPQAENTSGGLSGLVGTYLGDEKTFVVALSEGALTLAESGGVPVKLVHVTGNEFQTEEAPRRTVTFTVQSGAEPTLETKSGEVTVRATRKPTR